MPIQYEFFPATDAARQQYAALELGFVPQVDINDPPQVGCFVAFGQANPPQWFIVTAKEYIFSTQDATTVIYNLDVYQPPAKQAAP
jgi:hypothetical protein